MKYQYCRIPNPGGFKFGFQPKTTMDLLCGIEDSMVFLCFNLNLREAACSGQMNLNYVWDLNPDVASPSCMPLVKSFSL